MLPAVAAAVVAKNFLTGYVQPAKIPTSVVPFATGLLVLAGLCVEELRVIDSSLLQVAIRETAQESGLTLDFATSGDRLARRLCGDPPCRLTV